MRHFTELRVWQTAHTLAMAVFRLSLTFPQSQRFGITAQLQRAALSVPTNISEGAKRESAKEFARFLNIAEGSLAEVQYLLLAGRELQLGDENAIEELERHAADLAKRLGALKKAVRKQAA